MECVWLACVHFIHKQCEFIFLKYIRSLETDLRLNHDCMSILRSKCQILYEHNRCSILTTFNNLILKTYGRMYVQRVEEDIFSTDFRRILLLLSSRIFLNISRFPHELGSAKIRSLNVINIVDTSKNHALSCTLCLLVGRVTNVPLAHTRNYTAKDTFD